MNKYFACKVAAVDSTLNEDLQSRIPLSKIVYSHPQELVCVNILWLNFICRG